MSYNFKTVGSYVYDVPAGYPALGQTAQPLTVTDGRVGPAVPPPPRSEEEAAKRAAYGYENDVPGRPVVAAGIGSTLLYGGLIFGGLYGLYWAYKKYVKKG